MSKKKEAPDSKATLGKLRRLYDTALSRYSAEHRHIKLLDATDNGQLWQALGVKFPPYQILPDTNWVSYVKSNLVSSIYTVAKAADLAPTSEKDKDIIMKLNIALDRIWALCDVGNYQFQAGEWAALTNLGITQVGWDDTLTMGGEENFIKGNVALKNVDPLKFMRDPFATSLDTAGYCMTYDVYHKSVFEENDAYKEEFEKYLAGQKSGSTFKIPQLSTHIPAGADDYYTLLTFWIREGGKINEIHTVNCEHILYEKEDIQPSMFPFAMLYCNYPRGGRTVGVSECSKIFANNVAFNLLDSIAATTEYRNQNASTYVSSDSDINAQFFAKNKDNPRCTYTVKGDPTKAVAYQRYPEVSAMLSHLRLGLGEGIQRVSGVDARYTGRDTGSILTTGGMEDMLNRVTLVDTPKIENYEKYAKTLTKLILANYLEFGQSRKYLYKKPDDTQWNSTEVDFPNLAKEAKDTVFHYELNVSSLLPKNRQRLAQTATVLMEKQMQYGNQGGVELITPQEWLMMQDLPNKEMLLERMGIQRSHNLIEDISETLFEYGELAKQGMDPEQAILSIAKNKERKMQGAPPLQANDPTLEGGMPLM